MSRFPPPTRSRPASGPKTLTTSSDGGTDAIDLTGNALKQEIVGNAGANVLHDGVKATDDAEGAGRQRYISRLQLCRHHRRDVRRRECRTRSWRRWIACLRRMSMSRS